MTESASGHISLFRRNTAAVDPNHFDYRSTNREPSGASLQPSHSPVGMHGETIVDDLAEQLGDSFEEWVFEQAGKWSPNNILPTPVIVSFPPMQQHQGIFASPSVDLLRDSDEEPINVLQGANSYSLFILDVAQEQRESNAIRASVEYKANVPTVAVHSLFHARGSGGANYSARLLLRTIQEELDEDDIPPTFQLAKDVTGLIQRLRDATHLPIDISGMPEGDITLNISAKSGPDMVFIHCDADGTVYCMVKIRNERERRSYPSITSLPNIFIRRALEQLSSMGE